jgi:hypothetical protein
MEPNDVMVFPLDTPNQKIVDLKQYLAAQKSLDMLEQEIQSNEEYGAGYKRLLQQRATECRVLMAKIEEKYRGE